MHSKRIAEVKEALDRARDNFYRAITHTPDGDLSTHCLTVSEVLMSTMAAALSAILDCLYEDTVVYEKEAELRPTGKHS